MRIICDMDEVIVDMMNPLLKQYNRMYSSDITIDDVTQWQLPDDMINKFKEDDFFIKLPPISGAIDGLIQLREWGHDVIVATNHSDNPRIAKDKILWMFYNYPDLSENMMIGGRKDILQGDIIIDDNADYLINSPCPIKICMDRPWNRHLPEYSSKPYPYGYEYASPWDCMSHRILYRVGNWQEILNLISNLFNGRGCV